MGHLRHALDLEEGPDMLMGCTPARAGRARGFTLVELMIAITLLAIVLGLAVPFFGTMIRNTRIRSVSEALQNGLRTAQTEAVRRNRQVVFSLTNAEPSLNSAAVANGANWAIHTVPPLSNAAEVHEFIQGGALSDLAAGVQITGPISICFNSAGRLVANAAPGVVNAVCTIDANPAYDIAFATAVAGKDRPLRVAVSLGGQVRMCDPAKTLSSTVPDGCP
jgi:type IV fimbrial biogenesis protein FimT